VFEDNFFSLLPFREGYISSLFTVFKVSLKRLNGAGESRLKLKGRR
jgi:hypothetical protein